MLSSIICWFFTEKKDSNIEKQQSIFILKIISLQLLLIGISNLLFDTFKHINYYNLVLEFVISICAVFLLFAILPYKKFDFYKALSVGYFLLFVSYFVDSIDQIFIHSIVYTVVMEKITLILAAVFIYVGSKQWMDNFKAVSLTDDLTEIPNRKLCREIIAKEILISKKQESPLCLAVLDIDYFKEINDKHGHNTGDKILKSFAQLLLQQIRKGDSIGRWGGEEFLILLKDVDIDCAYKSMNRLRNKIAQHEFGDKNQSLTITVSIGISQMNPTDDFESLFIRADKVLFEAKEAGRNTVKF